MTPDIVFTNPYGAATFAGQGEVVEYFGIAYTPINRGLFYTEPTYADPTQDPNSKLYISPDGTKVYLTQTANLFLFNGCSRVDNLYFEEYLQYKECQTIAHYAYNPYYSEVWPDKRPVNLIATIAKYMYYATKEMETIYGIQSICDYHERFCTGENQQFHDFAECVRFMTALPVISPGCGIAGLTGGNSSTCRFKHHTLIPMDPKFHCFHIGYGHREDASGHFKCNDQVECYENYTTNPNLGDPKLIDLTDLTPLDKLCIEQGRAALNPGRPTPNATWNAHSPPNICCITNPYCPSGDQGASELKRRRSIMQ